MTATHAVYDQNKIIRLECEVVRLLAENERMRKALAWYADENNYYQRCGCFVSVPDCDGGTLQAPALDDRGGRARGALEQEPRKTVESKQEELQNEGTQV